MTPPAPAAKPFTSTEEAWFWTIGALRARRLGGRQGGVVRPCDPDDVIRCLDSLYRRRRIELQHARVLRIWGEQGTTPSAAPRERGDASLWREAIQALDPLLRAKGIVA